MNKMLKSLAALMICCLNPVAFAATDWSAQDYDLYPGDFNGDGRSDILYVAKDVSKPSGIALSDGSGPNVPFQSWPSNYLGIPWGNNLYRPIVADFNGDGKADILMQRSAPGDHYLLLGDSNNQFTGIAQTIPNSYAGLVWSADQHVLVAGKFKGFGGADLFFQATSPTGINAVVYSSGGVFSQTAAQSWNDGFLGFKWSTKDALIYAADFNGDFASDLLIQARPKFVTVDYELPIPVPTYPPNMNGVVLNTVVSDPDYGTSTYFGQAGVRAFSRMAFGIDWSPLTTNIVVADFNGDNRSDVLLQSKYSGRTSYLATGNASGSVFANGTALANNVALSSDGTRIIAARFGNSGAVGIYLQALTPAGTNSYASSITGATITTTVHNPAAATGVQPATAVGFTEGAFEVGRDGSANYSIPIAVPTGIGGVQPELGLTYSSRRGNDWLGVGWEISGVPEISRCARNFAQDGAGTGSLITIPDRFCLNGNRLRLVSGTYGAAGSTYQTEIEAFARVTAYGTAGSGPAYFIVETKDGLKHEYGNTTDSRIEIPGSSTPRVWALNKVSDRSGNTMTVTYTESTTEGSFHPNEMLYTANASASVSAAYKVKFFWDTRATADQITSYFAGSMLRESGRLNRIEAQYNDPATGGFRLVRKYQLSYNMGSTTGHTRIAAVQVCDGGGSCLEPTTIGWQEGQKGFNAASSFSVPSPASGGFALPLDVNGDGRTDVVYPAGTTWQFRLANTAGGFGAQQNTGIANVNYQTAIPVDYNGDGRVDILTKDASNNARILLSSGSGFSAQTLSFQLTGPPIVGDVNGDGRPDLVQIVYPGQEDETALLRLNGASGWGSGGSVYFVNYNAPTVASDRGVIAGDFNGDGRVDVILRSFGSSGAASVLMLANGVNFTNAQASGYTSALGDINKVSTQVADFNGDGIDDLAYVCGTTWCLRFGNGVGLGPETNTAQSAFAGVSTTIVPIDWDGDGKTDLLQGPTNNNWDGEGSAGTFFLLRSTGQSLSGLSNTAISSAGVSTALAIDSNGDGLSDLADIYPQLSGDGGVLDTLFGVNIRRGPMPDVINSIANGFGSTTAVAYAPLTDASVYTKGSGATFPQKDIQVPMYVVRQVTSSDGAGGTYSRYENYSAARIDSQGRGSLGFASRTETDSRTGISSTLNYRQDFPFIGQVSSAVTKQPGGTVIAQTNTTYTDLVTSSTTYADRHFPYPSTSTKTMYEVGGASNGQAIVQVTMATTVDAYGNPTSVTTTTTDQTGGGASFTTQTASTYGTADLTNWCLDFISQQQVINTIPGPSTQTRTVQYVKDTDAQKCRASQQITEPGSSMAVTVTHAFDLFGHTTTETVSAADIANRVTTSSYGPKGVFPVSVVGPEGETASKTYDYALGLPLNATDPNGLVTSFQYDGFGRVVRATKPDGTSDVFTLHRCNVINGYCGNGLLRYYQSEQSLTAANAVIRSKAKYYDSQARVLFEQSQTTSGAFSVIETRYDNLGRVAQKSEPYFAGLPATFTTFGYDLIGRKTTETRPINDSISGTQTTTYGYSRLIETTTDANGKVTTQRKNAIGQVVQATDANGGVMQYQFDPFANLVKTIDPAGNQIVNTFNIRGLKTAISDPDTGNWSFTYYATGELKAQTDAKLQVVNFTYDKKSRPLTRVEPEGTTTYVYGASASAKNIGQAVSVSAPGGFSESYSYDSLGRLQDITRNADGATYVVTNTYDTSTGQLQAVTYPTSTSAVPSSRFKVKYEYAYGLLKSIKDFNSPSTVFWQEVASNASGQPIDEQYGNGLHTYSVYDSVTGLLNSRVTGATAQVQNLSYQWDREGNLTQRKDANLNLTEDFVYDNLYRLDSSKLNGVTNLDPGYDALGNITSMTGVGTYTYHATKKHAVISTSSGGSYSYDANGNMTGRNGSTITWTTSNLPSVINKGGNSSQFWYAPDRTRYKQVAVTAAGGALPAGTETTIYMGSLFEKVTKPGGVTEYKHYILAGKEPVAVKTLRSNGANDTRYLHKDHLGSADTITNESAGVVLRLSFDAFGKRRNASAWSGSPSTGDFTLIAALTHLGFTGHETLDNVELIHMNGRVYDPALGRFISADPFIQDVFNSQSFNRYSYVENNPLSFTDPSGFFLKKLRKKLKKFVKRYFAPIVLAVVATAIVVVACVYAQCNPAALKVAYALYSEAGYLYGTTPRNSGGGGGGGSAGGGGGGSAGGPSIGTGDRGGRIPGAIYDAPSGGGESEGDGSEPDFEAVVTAKNVTKANVDISKKRGKTLPGLVLDESNLAFALAVVNFYLRYHHEDFPGKLSTPLDFTYVNGEDPDAGARQSIGVSIKFPEYPANLSQEALDNIKAAFKKKATYADILSSEAVSIIPVYQGGATTYDVALYTILHEYGHHVEDAIVAAVTGKDGRIESAADKYADELFKKITGRRVPEF